MLSEQMLHAYLSAAGLVYVMITQSQGQLRVGSSVDFFSYFFFNLILFAIIYQSHAVPRTLASSSR